MRFLKSLIRSIMANLPSSTESVDASYLRNLPVPFLSQRKNTYAFIGKYNANWDATMENSDEKLIYTSDGDQKISMASRSCNITCVAMLLHYFDITPDTPDALETPDARLFW